jgi:Tol biopolymer transport system component
VPDLFARDDDRGPTQKPKWSPDGHWVAFLRSGSPRGALLFVKSRINSEERFLGLVCADTETWAADSKSVIAPSSKNVDSVNECEMTAFPIRAGETPEPLNLRGRLPALSRDGAMLAFVHEREIRLVSVTPEGRPVGGEKTVVAEPGGVSSLMWAANGKEILYVLLEDLTRLRRVDAHAAAVARDALRVDGEIASITVSGGQLIGGVESRINSIWVIDVAATKANPVMVRELPWNVGVSTISPDSKRLVYSVSSGGTSEVYVTSLREGEPQRLFSPVEAGIERLSWSPDGKQIAMIGETGSGPVRPCIS